MKTMLTEEHTEAVYEILRVELGVPRNQLTPDARIADFSPDSLTIIEISMALEERFNLSVPDESWEQIKTVADLLDLVAELLEASGNSRSN
jgi:acyl carrier protein